MLFPGPYAACIYRGPDRVSKLTTLAVGVIMLPLCNGPKRRRHC